MRAGIEPRVPAPHDLDGQLALFEVAAVHVGDFELAPRRRLEAGGDVRDAGFSSMDVARWLASNATTPYRSGSRTWYANTVAPVARALARSSCSGSEWP